MKKLMIGEIQTRFGLFMNNTLHIKTTPWLRHIREEFQNHFGAADDYLIERIQMNRNKHNGKSYDDMERYCKYFNVDGYKAGTVSYQQDHTKPKGRGLFVELTDLNNTVHHLHMVRFIKFHCNPEGILILEKLWFSSIV